MEHAGRRDAPRRARGALAALVLAVSACTGAPPTDAGGDDAGRGDASSLCRTDRDCDDGVFCNGDEHCAPDASGADVRGCASTPRSCGPSQRCDEARRLCSGTECVEPDQDGDGVAAIGCGGDDCDDTDADRFPGHPEVCDARGHDEDCDPCTLASSTTSDGDGDADGFVSAVCANPIVGAPPACDPIATRLDTSHAGQALVRGADCDDARASVRPDQIETCNGIDDNCNGLVDEGALRAFYPDADGDGYGAQGAMPTLACEPPMGFVSDALDCADTDATIHPGVREICNGIDDNCNGLVDDGEVPSLFYPDVDGDGFGDASRPLIASSCVPPAGYLADHGDCDDANVAIHVGATEICDGRDDDCSRTLGQAGAPEPLEDADGDGHAPAGAPCIGTQDDCDDTRASVFTGAPEICDGLDDDCDGDVDETSADASCAARLACVAADCTDVAGITAGDAHTCVRDAAGTIRCWGSNDCSFGCAGQLGDGTTLSRGTPGLVVGIDDALEVVGARGATCALRRDHSVWCWGDPTMVGDGNYDTPRLVPTATVLPADVVALGAASSVCAVSRSGTVACWGLVGAEYARPGVVAGIADATQVAPGDDVFACALRRTGAITCWGVNDGGQLGTGTVDAVRAFHPPADVVGVSDAREVRAAGRSGVCARLGSGSVVCWGNGVATPWPVPGLSDAVELAMGVSQVCARRADASVVCWGGGSSGTPSAITGLPAGDPAIGIAVGGVHSCARLASGAVYCWGSNASGQLGTGTIGGSSATPVAVVGVP